MNDAISGEVPSEKIEKLEDKTEKIETELDEIVRRNHEMWIQNYSFPNSSKIKVDLPYLKRGALSKEGMAGLIDLGLRQRIITNCGSQHSAAEMMAGYMSGATYVNIPQPQHELIASIIDFHESSVSPLVSYVSDLIAEFGSEDNPALSALNLSLQQLVGQTAAIIEQGLYEHVVISGMLQCRNVLGLYQRVVDEIKQVLNDI